MTLRQQEDSTLGGRVGTHIVAWCDTCGERWEGDSRKEVEAIKARVRRHVARPGHSVSGDVTLIYAWGQK